MDSNEPSALAPSGEEQDTAAEPVPEAAGTLTPEELLPEQESEGMDAGQARLRAIIEAAVYLTDEPLTTRQIAAALGEPLEKVKEVLTEMVREYDKPEHGLTIREVAEGYKMSTKAEHHEAIRSFVKKLKPPLKLSMAALETLAVVAYKQPITAPEIMEIRGVQGAGVLKTLLDRKVITTAGRKPVVGRPILYKTTKEFLMQFGLKNLSELPTLKEFEELARMALADSEPEAAAEQTPEDTTPAPAPSEDNGEVDETGPGDAPPEAPEPVQIPAAAEPAEPRSETGETEPASGSEWPGAPEE